MLITGSSQLNFVAIMRNVKAVKFMFKTSWYMKILKIINLYAMIMYYMIGGNGDNR